MELGVPLGQAVDGSASNDGSNLLEEMRVAYLLHRLRWSRQVVKEGRLVRVDEERTVEKANLAVKEYMGHSSCSVPL